MLNVNENEYCKLDVHYEADVELINRKRDEVLEKFRQYPVPGFRANKATNQAIKFHFKNQVAEELKKALSEEAITQLLFEKNVKPFGYPKFSVVDLRDDSFICEFSVYKKPDLELKQYKGFDLPAPHEEISIDQMAEQTLQELRYRHGETTPFSNEDFIEIGDSVIIDYQGFLDGELVEQLNAQGELVSVGKTNIGDFDTNLLGMKTGETREFAVHIPENSSFPEFANKTITFKTQLMIGSKIKPVPLSDELAAKFELKTLNELQEQVKSAVSLRMEDIKHKQLFMQISKRLIDLHSFEIPLWLSLPEAQMLAKNRNTNWETITDDAKEILLSQSTHNIKLSLILEKIREEEPDAQLSDEECLNIIKNSIYNSYGEEQGNHLLNQAVNTGHISVIFSQVRDEYTLGFIVKNSTIIE